MCSERLFAFDKMWRDEVMRRRKMVLKRKKKEPYPIIDLMIKNLSRSWRF